MAQAYAQETTSVFLTKGEGGEERLKEIAEDVQNHLIGYLAPCNITFAREMEFDLIVKIEFPKARLSTVQKRLSFLNVEWS